MAAFLFLSCKSEPKIRQADDSMMSAVRKLDVEVDNEIDPICGMKTAESLSDTVHYHGQVLGFCSPYCKQTFQGDPEKYWKD